MPIQMFTPTTAISASDVLISHGTPVSMMPRSPRNRFSAPLSLSRIQRHTALETMSGSSQGSRSRLRRIPLSGNFCWKKIASARPITNWPRMDPTVNSAVLSNAVENNDDDSTVT
ncbi:hypothetical protein D9M72_571850 [compost metagenome]